MNKNLNNSHGKGTQKGQIINQENRQNDTKPSKGSTHINRNRDPQQVDAWLNKDKDPGNRIYPVESSAEKTIDREKDEKLKERMAGELNPGRKNNPVNLQGSHTSENEKANSSFNLRTNKENSENELPPTRKPFKKDKSEIHRVESQESKSFNRKEVTGQLGASAGKNNVSKGIGTNGIESSLGKSTNQLNGSFSSKTNALNDHGRATNASTFHTRIPFQEPIKEKESEKVPVKGGALYGIAAVFLLAWAVGFFYFNAGTAIHALLVLALVSVLVRVAQGRND